MTNLDARAELAEQAFDWLLGEIGWINTHGGDHHFDNCNICEHIAKVRAALRSPASAPDREAVDEAVLRELNRQFFDNGVRTITSIKVSELTDAILSLFPAQRSDIPKQIIQHVQALRKLGSSEGLDRIEELARGMIDHAQRSEKRSVVDLTATELNDLATQAFGEAALRAQLHANLNHPGTVVPASMEADTEFMQNLERIGLVTRTRTPKQEP